MLKYRTLKALLFGPTPAGAAVVEIDAAAGHLLLYTKTDGKTVRINSRDFTATSGSIIGSQSKPAASVTGTASVIGGETSPRFNDGIAGTNIIGKHIDVYLKGTTGNLSGVARVLELEAVSDLNSVRTIAGDLMFARGRMNMSCAVTGDVSFIRVEAAEDSLKWDCFAKLDEETNLAAKTGSPAALPANTGYIRVKVGDTFFKIPLYAS
jgi:hypothetical protein